MVVTKNLDTGELICHSEAKTLKPLIEQSELIIGHNLIGFDAYHLMNLWKIQIPLKKCWDTLIVSRLLKPDIADGHSLEAWGRRLDSKKIDYTAVYKELRLETDASYVYLDKHEWDDPILGRMQNYCEQDVELTAKLFTELKKQLKSQKFSDYSVELEQQVAWIVALQVRNGVLIDQRALMLLKAEVEDELADLMDRMVAEFEPNISIHVYSGNKTQTQKLTNRELWWYKDVPKTIQSKAYDLRLDAVKKLILLDKAPIRAITDIQWVYKLTPFNPGSRTQIIDRLVARGWKPTEYTEKGNVVLDEETLKAMDIPEAKVFLRFFELQKINSFLTNWDDKIEADGRIHGKVITNGAVTGRMTHSSPNLGQVPSAQTELGKRCRALFTVPEGCSMVGIDASGLELRMLAHYMQDDDYIKAVCEGKSSDKTDVHSINQRSAGLDTRDQAKTFIYAFLYGAGAEKIGSIAGGGAHKGKQLINAFLEATPALQSLRTKVTKIAEKGSLPGLDGRRLFVRSPHKALNTLLQGAGAAVMKVALVLLDDSLKASKIPYKFLLNVHDEVQIEVPTEYADKTMGLGMKAIEDAGVVLKLRCPLAGEAKKGANWFLTH